jgi:hypothetical protein
MSLRAFLIAWTSGRLWPARDLLVHLAIHTAIALVAKGDVSLLRNSEKRGDRMGTSLLGIV